MSRSTPRKSRKSSIYRHIENITLWVMDISGKTPKVEPFISQTKRVTDELENALATCQYADDEKVLEEKMKLINIMCYHLTSAKVVIRLWHQYSLRHTEIRKIIDEKQISFYLVECARLGLKINSWRNHVLYRISREEKSNEINQGGND